MKLRATSSGNVSRVRVIVTGCAGFIGAHFCHGLIARNDEVFGVDNFSPFHPRDLKEERWSALCSSDTATLEEFDISTGDLFTQYVADVRPDAIVHLAAQAGVRYSNENPDVCLRSNVIGTSKVFEAARKSNVPRVVYASSSSVYGAQRGRCVEGDPSISPTSIYGASKLATEYIARTEWSSHGLRTVGARFFTAYGEWGRPDMAYFRLMVAAHTGAAFPLLADVTVERDFTYVGDVVQMVSQLMMRADSFDNPTLVVNVGGGRPCSLAQMVSVVESVTGKKIQLLRGEDTPGDVPRTDASTDLITSLGLPTPTTTLNEGLAKVGAWTLEHLEDARRWVGKMDQ